MFTSGEREVDEGVPFVDSDANLKALLDPAIKHYAIRTFKITWPSREMLQSHNTLPVMVFDSMKLDKKAF